MALSLPFFIFSKILARTAASRSASCWQYVSGLLQIILLSCRPTIANNFQIIKKYFCMYNFLHVVWFQLMLFTKPGQTAFPYTLSTVKSFSCTVLPLFLDRMFLSLWVIHFPSISNITLALIIHQISVRLVIVLLVLWCIVLDQ